MSIHVLIIGGGIGGLCLAHGLKKRQIAFSIFERDAGRDYRAQGYRIRIAREGVEALRDLFDEETWRLFELTSGNTKLRPIPEVDATTAEVAVAHPEDRGGPPPGGPEGKPYTVDRTMLREVLLRGVKEHINYGKALDRYETSDNGVTAFFKDGTSAQGSLLIGADGAHSVVRKQFRPDHPILDTSGRCIYGKSLLTPDLSNALQPTITEGGMVAVKDRSREHLLTMVLEPVVFPNRAEMIAEGFPCPDDYLYWVMSTQPDVLDIPKDEVPHLTPQQSEKLALQVAEKWHATVRPIVERQMHGQTAVLPINSVPPDFGTWELNERVTLLGDAVHLMGPTAGSGAICAIRDADLLCRLLAEKGQSKEMIGEYEQRMREYAGEVVQRSWTGAKYIFGLKSSEDRNLGEVMMLIRTGKLT